MPKGPNGEKRPADVIGAAVLVGRIATGEAHDDATPEKQALRHGGRLGGHRRAAAMPREHRVQNAAKASGARWKATAAEPEKKEPQEH